MAKKLTEREVAGIKKLLSKGQMTREEIAEEYDVEVTAIKRISSGRTWAGVKGPKPKRAANVATNEAVIKKLVRRRENGEHVKEVASDLGIDWSTAYRLLRKYRESQNR